MSNLLGTLSCQILMKNFSIRNVYTRMHSYIHVVTSTLWDSLDITYTCDMVWEKGPL